MVFKPVRAPGSPAGGQAPGSLGGQGAQTPSIHPHPPTQGMMADGALQAFQAQTKGDTFYVQLVGGLKVGKHVKGEDKKGDRDGDENENGRNGSGEGIVSNNYFYFSFFPSFFLFSVFGILREGVTNPMTGE